MTDPVHTHYGRGDLRGRILDALRASGKNVDALTREDLTSFDEFHVGGIKETRMLAERVKLAKGTHVLDVGCGIGGPARTLAAEFGCKVTGLDMTNEFCVTGEMLTKRLGMSDAVTFQQGSGTDMPFANGQFDAVWLQHVGMNIQDKQKLYSEIQRVLKPGGTFIFHEILTGNGEPFHFPVMWAEKPEFSHVTTSELIRSTLTSLGMTETYWEDVTPRAITWFEERKKAIKLYGPPAISLAVLFGADMSTHIANIARNITEGRAKIVQAAFKKS